MAMKKKAQSSDYPIFAFRLSAEDKATLLRDIERVEKRLNKDLGENDYAIRKNDVIVKALRIGLSQLLR